MNAAGNDVGRFDRPRCLALLASVPVGRVVYTDRALPAVMPVGFVLADAEVVIATGPDAAWAAAVRDAVVAFQADALDLATMTGWSVVVTGRARLTGDSGAALVRIPATHVSGLPLGLPGMGRTA
jgi:uncharacterized protein